LALTLKLLQSLADRLPEPVTVIDRDFTIVYANRAASTDWNLAERGIKCYAYFAGLPASCPLCPAPESFRSGEPRSTDQAMRPGCGLTEVFPIAGLSGQTPNALGLLNASSAASTKEVAAVTDTDELEPGELQDLIGRGQAMRRVKEMIRLVARSQAMVLLQGESGTGKELVARMIHRLSARRGRPFVVVDCGSLPETLLESELFGHVKGAFTGALFTKKGLFEEAEGGSIFLDEIADTTPHFQSKLLRVLQEGEIKPVGSNRSVKIDVRVISAANKNLLELVKAKVFREDLYYRLAVLPLDLPPLRERREDIPLLVNHFLRAASDLHGKPARPLDAAAMQALIAAPWPGNVRELKHTIERAVVTAKCEELTLQDFPLLGPPAGSVSDLRAVSRHAAESVERARIEEALRQCAGKKSRAAKTLRISRASLYNKLRAYQIE
jgi:two-component system response regulator AtoC